MKKNYFIKWALSIVLVSFVANGFAQTTKIWLEAENGTVGSNWQILDDANASNGKFIQPMAGFIYFSPASEEPVDQVTYQFTTSEAGVYKIWGRVMAVVDDDDSFWVKVDDGSWNKWNLMPHSSDWIWNFVFDQNVSSTAASEFTLEPGAHVLHFAIREDATQLDRILITNTDITPEGLGGATGINKLYSNLTPLSVSPNPSNGKVNIECADGFNSLNVYNQLGQLVYADNYNTILQQKRVDLNLKSGIYFVTVKGNEKSGVKKLVIE